MTVLAILFLTGVVLRVILFLFDSGFGGPVWNTVMWVSATAWIAGMLMSIHVLTGWSVRVVS